MSVPSEYPRKRIKHATNTIIMKQRSIPPPTQTRVLPNDRLQTLSQAYRSSTISNKNMLLWSASAACFIERSQVSTCYQNRRSQLLLRFGVTAHLPGSRRCNSRSSLVLVFFYVSILNLATAPTVAVSCCRERTVTMTAMSRTFLNQRRVRI